MLERTLGPYSPSSWRFFGHSNDGWVEATDSLEIEVGRAYWVLAREGDRDLTTGPGTTIPTTPAFPISLQEGWNLIGNPFNFEVPLSNLRWKQSVAVPEILGFSAGWFPATALAPFEGYAVHSSVTDTMLVDGYLTRDVTTSSSATPWVWRLRVEARSGGQSDLWNEIGVVQGAEPGRDAFDRPEPPRFGEYVAVWFADLEWSASDAGARLDARPPGEREYEWTVVVEAPQSRAVDLRIEGLATVPANHDVYLIDDTLNISADLRQGAHYEVLTSSRTTARTLRLVVRDRTYTNLVGAEEQRVPGTTLDVFPIPSAGPVSIRYSVARDGQVDLRIFDAMGRLVDVIVHDEPHTAGTHVVVWQGRTRRDYPASPGAYFVSFSGPGHRAAKLIYLTR
jgi:hypothetical protein